MNYMNITWVTKHSSEIKKINLINIYTFNYSENLHFYFFLICCYVIPCFPITFPCTFFFIQNTIERMQLLPEETFYCNYKIKAVFALYMVQIFTPVKLLRIDLTEFVYPRHCAVYYRGKHILYAIMKNLKKFPDNMHCIQIQLQYFFNFGLAKNLLQNNQKCEILIIGHSISQ